MKTHYKWPFSIAYVKLPEGTSWEWLPGNACCDSNEFAAALGRFWGSWPEGDLSVRGWPPGYLEWRRREFAWLVCWDAGYCWVQVCGCFDYKAEVCPANMRVFITTATSARIELKLVPSKRIIPANYCKFWHQYVNWSDEEHDAWKGPGCYSSPPTALSSYGYHPDLQRIRSVFVGCSHGVNACNFCRKGPYGSDAGRFW